ncbi:MAG: malate dehydrogenase, partial [Candidatus Heimdallarchaeota archaeon]
KMDQWEVYPIEATAVGMKAIEQKVARVEMEEKELYKMVEERIKHARGMTNLLMEKEFIKPKI